MTLIDNNTHRLESILLCPCMNTLNPILVTGRHKHRAIRSLSESGGRGRPAMTARGFNQLLTGGGEAARLIESLHSGLLLWSATCRNLMKNIVYLLLTLFLHVLYSSCFISFLSFIQCHSSFPLFTLLITPPFYLPCCRSFFLPHQHILLQGI